MRNTWSCCCWILAVTVAMAAALASALAGVAAAAEKGTRTLCALPEPLGIESGALSDGALSASSFYVGAVGPQHARLNSNGAWCPRQPIAPGVLEWIQVDLGSPHLLTGVVTQGRFARGIGQEYAQHFRIQYARDAESGEGNETQADAEALWRDFIRFDGERVLPANSDTATPVTNTLRPAVVARRLRLIPVSAHLRTVCLRLELLGCNWTNPVQRYSMPQGDLFSPAISLQDRFYDGHGNPSRWRGHRVEKEPFGGEDSGSTEAPAEQPREEQNSSHGSAFLSDGLGQLVDGLVGLHSFGMDIGYGWGNAWVGWSRAGPGPGAGAQTTRRDHVEITFELDTVRRCQALTLHTNNFPSKGVEIFTKAVLQFSVGGVHYAPRNSHTYTPPSARVAQYGDSARNETIALPGQGLAGKFVRLLLFFRAEWLLLSEVYFECEHFTGNVSKELGGAGGSGGSGAGDELQMDFPDTQSSLEVLDGSGSSAVEIGIGVVCGVLLLALTGAGVVAWIRRARAAALTEGLGSSEPDGAALSLNCDCCASLKLLGYPADRMAWRFVPRNGDSSNDCGGTTPPTGGRGRGNSAPSETVTPHQAGMGPGADDSLVKDMLVTLSSLNSGGYTNTAAVLAAPPRDNATPPPKYSTLAHTHTHGQGQGNGKGLASSMHQYDNYGSTHYRKPKPLHRSPQLVHAPYAYAHAVAPSAPVGTLTLSPEHLSSQSHKILTLRRNQLLQALERERAGETEGDDEDADVEDEDYEFEYEGLLSSYAFDSGSPAPRGRQQQQYRPAGASSTSRRHQHQRRTLEHESLHHGLGQGHRNDSHPHRDPPSPDFERPI